MLNIGMMELILILLVAFLVVGPRDLPKVARWIARQIKKLRTLIREVKKETGWDEFAAEFKETRDDIKDTLKEADVRSELQSAARDIETEVNTVQEELKTEGEKLRADFEGGNKS